MDWTLALTKLQPRLTRMCFVTFLANLIALPSATFEGARHCDFGSIAHRHGRKVRPERWSDTACRELFYYARWNEAFCLDNGRDGRPTQRNWSSEHQLLKPRGRPSERKKIAMEYLRPLPRSAPRKKCQLKR